MSSWGYKSGIIYRKNNGFFSNLIHVYKSMYLPLWNVVVVVVNLALFGDGVRGIVSLIL